MANDNNKAKGSEKILRAPGEGKARLIAILMVVIAIFIGTRGSLMKLRNEALGYFTDGDPSNSLDYGIQYDLNEKVSFAGHLITISKRYGVDENDSFIKNIKTDCEKLQGNADPNVKFRYNEQLTQDAYALVQYLQDMMDAGEIDITDSDIDLIAGAIVDMESADKRMGHSVYNDKARAFNQTLSAFPTNVTRLIAFVKPLTLFDY